MIMGTRIVRPYTNTPLYNASAYMDIRRGVRHSCLTYCGLFKFTVTMSELEAFRTGGVHIKQLDVCSYHDIESRRIPGTVKRTYYFTLVKEQSRLYVRRHSFSQRTMHECSKLSTDCVYMLVVIVCWLHLVYTRGI